MKLTFKREWVQEALECIGEIYGVDCFQNDEYLEGIWAYMADYNDDLKVEMQSYTVTKDEFYSAFIDVQDNYSDIAYLTDAFDDVWCKLRKRMDWTDTECNEYLTSYELREKQEEEWRLEMADCE